MNKVYFWTRDQNRVTETPAEMRKKTKQNTDCLPVSLSRQACRNKTRLIKPVPEVPESLSHLEGYPAERLAVRSDVEVNGRVLVGRRRPAAAHAGGGEGQRTQPGPVRHEQHSVQAATRLGSVVPGQHTASSYTYM